MCGIVGYTGVRLAAPLLIEGLRRLEYRGYDSAGIALPASSQLEIIKRADPNDQRAVELIADLMTSAESSSTIGLGHTRWATHGARTDVNAHPHTDCSGRLAVVHNGQITNHVALRRQLQQAGHQFRSSTDTEIIPHLIEMFLGQQDDLITAVRKTAKLLEGAFAFVVLSNEVSATLIGARRSSPLCIGIMDDGRFLASDPEAFLASTSAYIDVNDGEIAIVEPTQHRIVTFDNEEVTGLVQQVQYELEQIERGTFATFMAKEIHEQPEVVHRVFEGRVTASGLIRLGGIERRPDFQRFIATEMTDIILLGCGTSLYAGMMIERQLQELGFRARAIDAAEFTTGPSLLTPGTLVIPISQSGETRDLLDAMERVKASGCWSFAMCNKPATALTKYGTGLYLHAGPEKGVASTKAFLAQVLSGWLLSLNLGSLTGRVNTLQISGLGQQVRQFEAAATEILSFSEEFCRIGAAMKDVPRMLYIGRGYNLPLAMEGALKMMEITQIPSLGMSAAAMKHGPISLVDSETVIVAVCLPDPRQPDVLERSIENVHQVVSAAGRVTVVTTEATAERFMAISHGMQCIHQVIAVPDCLAGPASALAVIPLQLLALGTAEARGLNVDKPRNLAKAVTVT